MALAQTVLEQLTCPICQDIFDNPMVLKCHHSVCADCLEGLKGASLVRWKIECPVCRHECPTNDITADFRTITLLEAHKNNSKSSSTQIDTDDDIDVSPQFNSTGCRLCDLCSKAPVNQKCQDCQKLFCRQCSRNHKTLPACQDHRLEGLKDTVEQEKASLRSYKENFLKEERRADDKQKEISEFKSVLNTLQEKAISDIENWYDGIVSQATKQRDALCQKTRRILEAELDGIQDKERLVTGKQSRVKESLRMIQELQTEEDPAMVLGRIDTLKSELDQITLDGGSNDVSNVIIPNFPHVQVSVGKKWDETKAIRLNIKKPGSSKNYHSMVSFPSNLSSATFSKQKEIQVSSGTKQLLINKGYVWCLYDDHIDMYDMQGTLFKSICGHVKNPNGLTTLPNGSVVVACMIIGLVHFSSKGKYLSILAEGNMCDVSADQRLVYGLDYTAGKACLKAFKKKHFKWQKVTDVQLQNEKCNTFNTLLSNQTSVFVSSTEEDILVEYTREGEMVSSFIRPLATRLCTSDTWGNVLLTNYGTNKVHLFKNDQSWHQVNLAGVRKPHGVAVDEDGAIWVSNPSNVLEVFCSQ